MKFKEFFVFLTIIVMVVFMLSGCETVIPSDYELKNIYSDPQDISINDQNANSKICFDIKNNAKTTLIPKIELSYDDLGNKCLDKSSEQKLSEIVPNDEKHHCVTVSLKWDVHRNSKLEEECKNKKISIGISLQDITGVELNKGTVSLGLI